MKISNRAAWAALCLIAGMALSATVRAESIGDFYRGKTMRVIIGYGVGGGYDLYGRIVAEFLGRHIPGNPTIVAQNIPGAGGFAAAAYLYNVAPKDGTYLGSVSETLALDTAIAKENDKKIDARRLPYLGRLTSNIEIGVARPGSKIKSFEDARAREIAVGASGPASATNLYPLALNRFSGTKFKLVRGYTSVNEILLATERGEVELAGAVGLPFLLTSHPDWIVDGKATIIYQGALRRHALLANVPLVHELATNDEGRLVLHAIDSSSEVGKSILTTPDVPPERVAALRQAFQDMLRDPQFLAAAQKRSMMIDPDTGESMDAIVQETMRLPQPVLNTLAELLKE
jgi:tripartite-type tricarboxylate transporter receptor subunit TctC